MSLYKRGETYWVYFVHDGRRIRRSAFTADRNEAQRIHDQQKAQLWNVKQHGHTLNDALVLWLQQSERSRNEKNAVKLFLKLYPNRPLNQITGASIASALSAKGPAHANRIINCIGAALNLAHEAGLCEAVKIPRRKPPKSRIRWLKPKEWSALDFCLIEFLKISRFCR